MDEKESGDLAGKKTISAFHKEKTNIFPYVSGNWVLKCGCKTIVLFCKSSVLKKATKTVNLYESNTCLHIDYLNFKDESWG